MKMNMSSKCDPKDVHHCPVEGCIYASGSERYFANKKLLNQHTGKVHAEKKYTCNKCQKGFGTNWLKEHHELTCGKSWTCVTCKQSYGSRESLLSHARRKEHDLTEEVKKPPKALITKMRKKTYNQPVIFLIQPIIQSQTLEILSRSNTDSRIILPKFTIPLQLNFLSPSDSITYVPTKARKPLMPATIAIKPSTAKITPSITPITPPIAPKETAKSERKQKLRPRTAAETQTCKELQFQRTHISRSLESRGSQSYAQGMKRPVGIESTYTQTTESSVNRLKKKSAGYRSKRKSVAVVTDPSVVQPTRSLWSDLEEFILPDSFKANRSSGTQTVPNLRYANKEMRDSQTLTDIDLFPLALATTTEQHPLQVNSVFNTSNLADKIEQESNSTSTTTELGSLDLWSNNINSENTTKYDNLLTSVLDDGNSSITNPTGINTQTESSFNTEIPDDLGSILDTMIEESNAFVTSEESPVLLHTETQTNLSCDMDYTSYLANTETQTNDDLLFSDLEFFDTETQTPWDDIASLSEGLQVDQLSIEIQTDFSIVSPFTPTAHMETQTPDLRQISELTNSEAQTLIASSPLFD